MCNLETYIFRSGVGINEIARRLEAEGIKTGRGRTKWWQSTIQSILTNEKYCGDLLQQKCFTPDYLTHKRVKNTGQVQQYYVRDNHEAIIDRESWEKVQIIYARNRDKYRSENKGLTKYSYCYPLSGRCVCLHCGETFKRRHWIQGYPEPRIVYQCNGYINGKLKERCPSYGISEDILMASVCDMINNLFINEGSSSFDNVLAAIKNKMKVSNESYNELEEYESRREVIDEEITQLLKAKIDAKDNDEIYFIDKKYHDKLNEYRLVSDKIKTLTAAKAVAIDVEQRLATMESILSKRKITPAMITPEIMDAFIYRVIIAGKHEIYFLIDINHNYSLKEVKQLRRKIVEMKPIYSNKVELARKFRDEHLTYKVIAI